MVTAAFVIKNRLRGYSHSMHILPGEEFKKSRIQELKKWRGLRAKVA
jgi:hypothetical protein